MMNPASPFFFLLPLGAAMLTAWVLATRCTGVVHRPPGRYAAIDGLRGYLAFFVFIYHASVWFFYLRSGEWAAPPSNLYTSFGQSSVALFFMITAFLFFSKLLERGQEIDWLRLFVSRVLRLLPMYLFVMALMLVTVGVLSHFVLKEPPGVFVWEVLRWLGFTILGAPDINQVQDSGRIVAGVIWSLPYEWFFYFALPLMAWPLGRTVSWRVRGFSALFVGVFLLKHLVLLHVATFLGGILAAVLVRHEKVGQFAQGRIAALISIACLVVVALCFRSAYGPLQLALLSVAFVIIACGNTYFGVLVAPVSRVLGEVSYSIYLLHGFLLFVLFRFVLGYPAGALLSPSGHWLVMTALAPVLVLASFATFSLIEAPAMARVAGASAWLRTRMPRRSVAACASR